MYVMLHSYASVEPMVSTAQVYRFEKYKCFLSPNEHVERRQGHLGSVFSRSAPFGPGRLVIEKALSRAVKARVQVVTCLRIHVTRHVTVSNWLPLS